MMTAALWFAGAKIKPRYCTLRFVFDIYIYGGDKERKLIQGWKTGGTVERGEEVVGGREAS